MSEPRHDGLHAPACAATTFAVRKGRFSRSEPRRVSVLLAAAAAARTAVREGLFGFASIAACRRVGIHCVGPCRAIGRHDVEVIACRVRLNLRNRSGRLRLAGGIILSESRRHREQRDAGKKKFFHENTFT
jgi:hypothetical protein